MKWVLLFALLAAGCGGAKEQSYRDGLEMFCEAPTKIADGRTRMGDAIRAVAPKITNKRVKELLERMPQTEGTEKVPMLRASVKVAGLSRCTVLEIWEEQIQNPTRSPEGGDPLSAPVLSK